MPDLTKNYGLKKPRANEYAKPDDFNYNFDKLDEVIGEIEAPTAELAGKLDKAGGSMTGVLKAQDNTEYTTYQVRNMALSTTAALSTGNGALLGVYS